METAKQRKKGTKLNYFLPNVNLDSPRLSELPDFVENCFIILEYFTLVLLNTNGQNKSETKLNYCYCYFNTVRWQLGNRPASQNNVLLEIAKSLIIRLQHSFELLCSPTAAYENMSNHLSKTRCLARFVLPRYNICKKKTRRKYKTYKRTGEAVETAANSAELLNKLCWTLFQTDSGNSAGPSLNMQQIIDQMYLQIQATLSENCIDDADIWKELGASCRSKSAISNMDSDIQQLQQKCQLLKMPEYQNFPCSGDCRTIDDCQDIFTDQFDEFVCLDNLDVDVASLTRKIFASKNTLFTLKNRFRCDSELDEGFSESEFVYEVEDKSVNGIESCELLACEEFYCTDYHYNSSNSKDIKHRKGILTTVRSVDHLSNDDEDSDGGTELLNIVNDSLNQFNHFMHHPTVSITDPDLPNKTAESQPTVCNSDLSSSSMSPATGLLSPTIVYTSKDESPCISSVNNTVHPFSVSSYDVISKLFLSPVAIQNWYAYNSSPPCAATNSNSPIITVNNYCTGSTKIGSNWLPVISHSVISTGQYLIGNGHQHQQHQHNQSRQQSFHRIMLSPHLPLTSANVGSQMQRGIVHLPQQLFHQLTEPHGMTETDCYEHRQLAVNPQSSAYSNPNNNNSSSEYPVLASAIANSNCSNFTMSPPVHAPCVSSHSKSCLDKSQRACCFYMRGGCKKEDCEYAHDLSKVTCKFWEKGDCFKSDTCPFKHGYMKT